LRDVDDLKLTGEVVILAGKVSDEGVRRAYSGADLTVLPSFEEGFGLPIIESMACGTPVACSNAACLPEVADNAAEYFDPADAESIASAIENVVLSNDRWRELQAFGFARAAMFDPQRFAQKHYNIYRQFC
jgi:glycosyltransferase involved in cell wall biosynthesis